MIRSDVHDQPSEGTATVSVERSGSLLVVTVLGDLDAASAPQASQAVLDRLDPDVDELWLELSGVGFCDSSGLKLLFHLRRTLADRGGALVVRDPSPGVQRVLDIVDRSKAIAVHRTALEAEAEAQASAV